MSLANAIDRPASASRQPPPENLHLMKLCVGVRDVEALERRVARSGAEYLCRTRMLPKQHERLIEGGSLYWVMKGYVRARQRILDIRPYTDAGGIKRCHIVLEPLVVATETRRQKAFQGWRYLKPGDAPKDMPEHMKGWDLPPKLLRALADLGCL